MNKKQAYSGLVNAEPQVVAWNTVVMVYPPAPGDFGTVLVQFRNGSASTEIDVGYGQPFSVLPLDGRIVSYVQLTAGTLNYYTTSRDLAAAFQSAAASPGGAQEVSSGVLLTGTGQQVIYTCPPNARAFLYSLSIVNTSSSTVVVTLQNLRASGGVNNITPVAGVTVPAAVGIVPGTFQLGSEPNCDLELPSDMLPLLPGDYLRAKAATGNVISVGYEYLTEPV